MEHDLYRTGDQDAPKTIVGAAGLSLDLVDGSGKVVHRHCRICGGLNGSLATECPGRVDRKMLDHIYHGEVDFRGGDWFELPLAKWD